MKASAIIVLISLLISQLPLSASAAPADYYYEEKEETTTPDNYELESLESSETDDEVVSESTTSLPFSEEQSTTQSAEFSSTSPSLSGFDALVRKAKDFAELYFSPEELQELHEAVKEARARGASLEDVRAVVTSYLNAMLTPDEKREIRLRKSELEKDFSDKAFLES